MVSSPAFLTELLDSVPVCMTTATRSQVMACLQTAGRDRLVVVDEQRQPVGLIRLTTLWSQEQATTAAPMAPEPEAQALMEPLPVCPDTLPLPEVLARVVATERPHALVNATGQLVGLLDGGQVARSLVQQWLAGDNAARSPTGLEQLAHWRSRRTPSRGPSPEPSPREPSSRPSPALRSLLELVERLPIPLMVQTPRGQVVLQNPPWQDLVVDLQNPQQVRQDAASLLGELTPEATAIAPPPTPTSVGVALGELGSMVSQGLPGGGLPTGALPGAVACQLGTQPGTCVCVCLKKNGQEQTLQFIKVPLGDWDYQGLTVPHEGAMEASTAAFQLGALEVRSPATPPSATPSEPGTTTPLWLILAQDITEQQQLARELTAKNADLMQLNRLKDEFLSCISHELRTPLTAVLGLSSLLKEQTLGELNPRQVRYAQLIHQSGRHLMAVVNDILDLTRMETGQIELVPEPVIIADICQQALEQARQVHVLSQGEPEPDPAEVLFPHCSLDLDPDVQTIVADDLRLRQMLIHLLSNAFKFTLPTQSVGLRVKRWGGWIAFTVWDEGIGIAADKQHLIFQKFQQLENPLTRRFEGTGLGLVLTQRLARLHGGDVTFLSQEGMGSQFTLLLPPMPPAHGSPIAPPQFASSAPPSAATNRAARRSASERNPLVMVVEAASHLVAQLTEQLTELGYQVVVARSGPEAIEKARRLQPCIIFLNPVLPLLSGWDVLTLLKSNPETRQIPIAVTASQVDQDHAYFSQAEGWLSQPVQGAELRSVLQKLVRSLEREPVAASARSLTILRLHLGSWSRQPFLSTTDLNDLLHSQSYRVLEADDLEQAEMLARVWKPRVIVLEGIPLDTAAYFRQFSQQTYMASLPIVTLEPETTQAANQVVGLQVFPCLVTPENRQLAGGQSEMAALLQVIQIAAGQVQQPAVLVMDCDLLGRDLAPPALMTSEPEAMLRWPRALVQYLQAAGFQANLGLSWQDVIQRLQARTVDLFVLRWRGTHLLPSAEQRLRMFQQMTDHPPILLLDHHTDAEAAPSRSLTDIPLTLQQMVSAIAPANLPMPELLEQIRRVLHTYH